MKLRPSKAPVDEKAQHDPQFPWFFTGVTAPFVLQSMVAGALSSTFGTSSCDVVDLVKAPFKHEMWAENSAVVIAANWFNPTVLV